MRSKLADFDNRAIEHLVISFEASKSYPHLSDLHVTSVYETLGREKRVRWFSTEGFRKRCELSKLEVPESLVPAPEAGGFAPLEHGFYATVEEFDAHARYAASIKPTDASGRKRNQRSASHASQMHTGRPRKYPLGTTSHESTRLRQKLDAGLDISEDIKALERKYAGLTRDAWLAKSKGKGKGTTKVKGTDVEKEKKAKGKGKGKGKGKQKKEGEADGQGQGKHKAGPSGSIEKTGAKRKRPAQDEVGEVDELEDTPPPPPKKRGRPKKVAIEDPPPPVPKKRGRPSKADIAQRNAAAVAAAVAAAAGLSQPTGGQSSAAHAADPDPPAPAPKKRGRPSKADLAARALVAGTTVAEPFAPSSGSGPPIKKRKGPAPRDANGPTTESLDPVAMLLGVSPSASAVAPGVELPATAALGAEPDGPTPGPAPGKASDQVPAVEARDSTEAGVSPASPTVDAGTIPEADLPKTPRKGSEDPLGSHQYSRSTRGPRPIEPTSRPSSGKPICCP